MYAWHWVIVWLQFLHYICVCLVVVLSGIAFMLLEMVWRNVAGNSNVCSLCSFHVLEKTATKLQLESTMCFCLALFTWTFGMWRHKQTCSFTEFDLSKTFKMPSLLVCNFFGGRLLWYFCSCICFGVVLAKGWMRSQSLEARTFGCKCCWACIAFAFFCEGKAFDTVVISRWLLAVVRGEPLNERCVPWPSNQKSQMQIQSIYF